MYDDVDLCGFDVARERLGPDVGLPPDSGLVEFVASIRKSGQDGPMFTAGWRVIGEVLDRVTVAAFDEERGGWTVVHADRTNGGFELAGAQYGVLPRPTAQERGLDFKVRFPVDRFEIIVGVKIDISVVITNDSPRPETISKVFGIARTVGSQEWGSAWFGYAPLLVHEIAASASVSVPITFSPPSLEVGEYELRVMVPELALSGEGAHLVVRRANSAR